MYKASYEIGSTPSISLNPMFVSDLSDCSLQLVVFVCNSTLCCPRPSRERKTLISFQPQCHIVALTACEQPCSTSHHDPIAELLDAPQLTIATTVALQIFVSIKLGQQRKGTHASITAITSPVILVPMLASTLLFGNPRVGLSIRSV